jgi:hypothetical protein
MSLKSRRKSKKGLGIIMSIILFIMWLTIFLATINCMGLYCDMMLKGTAPIISAFAPLIIFLFGFASSLIIPVFVLTTIGKFFDMIRKRRLKRRRNKANTVRIRRKKLEEYFKNQENEVRSTYYY